MPQLDFATYSSQIFWLVVCLTMIYLSFKFVFIPRLSLIVSIRNNTIAKMLQDAKEMQEETLALKKHYHDAIVQARSESMKLYNDKITEFEAQHERMIEDFRKKQEAIIRENKDELEKQHQELLAQVPEIAQELSQKFIHALTKA